MNTSSLFKYFAAIAISLLFAQSGFAQSSENQQIVFEGSLTDASGNTIDLAGAQLTFYVTANGCYLYGETSSISGDSQGNIIHRIGAGSQVAGSPNSFTQNLFFGNVSGTTTFAGNTCAVTAADTRLAQVAYDAESISASIKLGTVPYAHNATLLNGKNAADFIEVSNDTNTLFYSGSSGQYLTRSASGNLTWTSSSLTAGQISTALGYTPASNTVTLSASSITTALGYTPANSATLSLYTQKANNLSDLANPTTARSNLGLGTFATANSIDLGSASATGTLAIARFPAFTGDASIAAGSSTITVNKLRGIEIASATPSVAQVLAFNGSQWAPTTAVIGSVTSIFAGTGLLGGSITSSGTLSINFGTSAGTVAEGDDLRLVQALQSVNNLADITSAGTARANLGLGSIATKSIVNLTSDVSGVLPINNGGSKWGTHANGIFAASNTAIGTSVVPTATKLYVEANTAGQVARFNNLNTNGYGLRIDVAGTNSAQYALNIYNGSASSMFMVQNDGLVGLGTMTPSAKLHISPGSNTVAPFKFSNGTILSTPAAGALEYDGSKIYITDEASTRHTVVTGITSSSIEGINSINTANLNLNVSNTVFVSGNLALGTSNPTSKFHVYSNTAGSELARFDGGNSGYYMTFAANNVIKGAMGVLQNSPAVLFTDEIAEALGIRGDNGLQLGVGATPVITIATSTKVGIGTSNPTTALTVSGSIRTTAGGYEYADGTSQTTSAFGGYERTQTSCGGANTCMASCTAGKKIISGGCVNSASQASAAGLISSYPVSDTQWQCAWQGTGSLAGVSAWAICTKF